MKRGNFGKRHDRTGQVNMSNTGQLMTITKYDYYGDMQVTFEDGHVRDHMTYDAFQKRSIALEYDGRHDRKLANLKERKESTVKEMVNGQKCRCIEYRNKWDADFMFEDGCIITHTPWRNFEKGTLTNPRLNSDSRTARSKRARLHEKRQMANGETLEIIRYDNAKCITVKNTRTGETREKQTYQNFKKGLIRM